jgi:ribonucleoside-diphosphate reductase alpha chain
MVTIFKRPNVAGAWPDNALEVLRMRYLLKDENGNVIESADDRCWSVVSEIGKAELSWKVRGCRRDYRRVLQMMVERKFVPNSPTLMNAEKENNLQYSACYVLPVEDSIAGILSP